MSILPIGCGRALRVRAPRRWLLHALGVSLRLPLRLLLLLPLATGCGDQSLRPDPKPEPADLYWSLVLNHHAVAMDTMAPYDTLQLVATPTNYRDEPLAGLPAAQYWSADPERVAVLPNGQVIALAPTVQPVAIVATLTVNNLKHVDTAWVSVVATTTPPMLDNFSIQPVPPDSAKVGATTRYFPVRLPLRAVTAGGEPIPVYGRDAGGYLPVDFRSSDTSIAKLDPSAGVGMLIGMTPGSVNIYASTTAFGVRKADTLVYRVGNSIAEIVFIAPLVGTKVYANLTPSITIGVGGAVLWTLSRSVNATDTLDVTFAEADFPNIAVPQPGNDFMGVAGWLCADPAQCSGANFLLSASQPWGGRYFPTPGTYEYRSVRLGLTGRVVVVDER